MVNKLPSSAVYPSVSFHGIPRTRGSDDHSGLWLLGSGTENPVGVVDKHVITVTPHLDGSKIKDIMLRVVLKRKQPPTS